MQLTSALSETVALLPPRSGPRPRTRRALPYIQLDQWPRADITLQLIQGSRLLPDVRSKQSRMASPDVVALYLPDRVAGGPPDSFIDAHEFCHLHPPPGGWVHMMLPDPWRYQAVEFGWAEVHPAAEAGFMPETLVMVYAPRNEDELTVVLNLIAKSCQFAKGL